MVKKLSKNVIDCGLPTKVIVILLELANKIKMKYLVKVSTNLKDQKEMYAWICNQ